ncbi:MAG: hypothetical protein AB1801_23265 [Chloroflexota bacterium]
MRSAPKLKCSLKSVIYTTRRGRYWIASAGLTAQTILVGLDTYSKYPMPDNVKDELVEKTNLTEAQVGEYSGRRKEIKPVTISTYQTIIYRKHATDRNSAPGQIDCAGRGCGCRPPYYQG